MGKLYNEFLHMDEDESIGMVQEQTLKYMRAFGSYHIKSPSTKLGRPPSKGNPGFNPDLMVMDLVKLRADMAEDQPKARKWMEIVRTFQWV